MRRRATQKRGRRRLEGIQPRTDGGRAGCPHRRGSEAAEPPAPGPVGSAHRSAVFDSQGIRSECGRKGPECRKAFFAVFNGIGLGESSVRSAMFIENEHRNTPSSVRSGISGVWCVARAVLVALLSLPLLTELVSSNTRFGYRHGAPNGAVPAGQHLTSPRTAKNLQDSVQRCFRWN